MFLITHTGTTPAFTEHEQGMITYQRADHPMNGPVLDMAVFSFAIVSNNRGVGKLVEKFTESLEQMRMKPAVC